MNEVVGMLRHRKAIEIDPSVEDDDWVAAMNAIKIRRLNVDKNKRHLTSSMKDAASLLGEACGPEGAEDVVARSRSPRSTRKSNSGKEPTGTPESAGAAEAAEQVTGDSGASSLEDTPKSQRIGVRLGGVCKSVQAQETQRGAEAVRAVEMLMEQVGPSGTEQALMALKTTRVENLQNRVTSRLTEEKVKAMTYEDTSD